MSPISGKIKLNIFEITRQKYSKLDENHYGKV